MHYINITVREKSARADDRARIVCGNSDYAVRFDFDEEWEAYDLKTARFITEGGFFTDVQFTGSDCAVPVLTGTRTLLVGVFAGDVRTTTPAYIPAIPCITDTGGIPAAPPPDVYAQLMNRFAALEAPAAVLYTEQELTNEQKAQARKNIGAGTGTGEVTSTAIETALGYKPVNAFYVTVTPASSGDQTTGTADKTDAEIYAAYAAGSAVFCRVASEGHFFGHPATLPIFAAVKDGDNYMFAFCGSGAPRSGTGDAAVTVTVTRNQHNWYVFYDTLTKKTDIPTALKSPNALTLKLGGTTVVYDGSEAKTFEIPDGTEVSY
mgnify:FL=1